MCNATWTTGCKKHDVEVILVDPKTGKRLNICHACWGKVPYSWEWGKRRKRMSKEEKKAMADPNWKWDEIIVHKEEIKSDEYIPFAKKEGKVVAWVKKDAMKEKSLKEILKEAEEEETKKYRKKKKRKRRKKKSRNVL